MNKSAWVAIAVLTAIACQGADELKDSGGETFARKRLGPFLETGELPGAITIVCDGDRREVTCLGYADVEAKRPITLDDPFQQCSQTKGFCAVSVMMLVEEGKLALTDPVAKFLPVFREMWVRTGETNGVRKLEKAKNAITVGMCLNHTAGFDFELPNYEKMGGWSRRMPLKSAAVMAAALPLEYEPGTAAKYSNLGIDVAAAVVEAVTGRRWEDFLKERVLDPLGMKDSTFYPTDEQLSRAIGIYEVRPGTRAKRKADCSQMQRPFNDDRVFSSAGAGLWTTARDQYRFYRMLMNLGVGDNGKRLLKEETVKNLLAVSSRDKKLDSTGYSYGLMAPFEDGENAWFGHGGAWASHCVVNWHKRRLRLFVAQFVGPFHFLRNVGNNAADLFFQSKVNAAGVDAYTGRLK